MTALPICHSPETGHTLATNARLRCPVTDGARPGSAPATASDHASDFDFHAGPVDRFLSAGNPWLRPCCVLLSSVGTTRPDRRGNFQQGGT